MCFRCSTGAAVAKEEAQDISRSGINTPGPGRLRVVVAWCCDVGLLAPALMGWVCCSSPSARLRAHPYAVESREGHGIYVNT